MRNSYPVLPNFIKGLTIITVGVFSLNALAEHHGDSDEKTEEAMQMMKEQNEHGVESMEPITDKDAYKLEEAKTDDKVLTEEEKKMILEKHKRMAEMKKIMQVDEEQAPE